MAEGGSYGALRSPDFGRLKSASWLATNNQAGTPVNSQPYQLCFSTKNLSPEYNLPGLWGRVMIRSADRVRRLPNFLRSGQGIVGNVTCWDESGQEFIKSQGHPDPPVVGDPTREKSCKIPTKNDKNSAHFFRSLKNSKRQQELKPETFHSNYYAFYPKNPQFKKQVCQKIKS